MRMSKEDVRCILTVEGKPTSDACVAEWLLDRLHATENRLSLAMKLLDDVGCDNQFYMDRIKAVTEKVT